MASSPFERQVIEADSADDRSPVSSRMSDGPQQYEPVPSFVDHDRPSVRLVELPAWLQAFASSVGEPSEPEFSEPIEGTAGDDSFGPQDEFAVMETAPETKSSMPSPRGVSGDFISEDDLPEWLRSIVPEESSDTADESLALDHSGDGDHLAVPNVARAWSTSKDSRGVDESTSLFALVASQTPQHAFPDGEPASGSYKGAAGATNDASGRVGKYGSARPPGTEMDERLASLETAEGDSSGKLAKLSMLPVIVASILLLVLIGAAAALFLM